MRIENWRSILGLYLLAVTAVSIGVKFLLALGFFRHLIICVLPLLLCGVYGLTYNQNHKTLDRIGIIGPIVVFSLSLMILYSWWRGITPQQLFGFKWRYQVPLMYAMTFFLTWFTFLTRIKDPFNASLYTALTTICVGFIYEIPYFLKQPQWWASFINIKFPLFIESRLLGAGFTVLILRDFNFKPTKMIIGVLTLFATISILYYFNNHRLENGWILYRLPTMLLSIALPLGMKKQ